MTPPSWRGLRLSGSATAAYPRRLDDEDEPSEMLGLPAFGFADPGPLRDELTASVLAGTKTATTSLVADYIVDGEPLPIVGQRVVVFDSLRQPVAVIVTTAWRLSTIGLVDDDFARDEGEGYADAGAWRASHELYWNRYLGDYRRDLDDPDFVLTSSTPVVCEWFRLVARIDPATQELIEVGGVEPVG
jgi:uncharacterized protein YhfF